jgi:L-serine dehydratase
MAEKSSVFDMIGPIMVGPSSSHTAGVVRIGRAANKLWGSIPEAVEITFYNSFAQTFEGHGSDRAILAGLMDFKTDDLRIKEALQIAQSKGFKYTFKAIGNASTLHPNTVKLTMHGDDRVMEVIGESKGGGVINIAEVDGFKADFSASLHTLLIKAEDVKGSVAFIADVLAHDDCNIATMSVSRKGKDAAACLVFEMDSGLKDVTLAYLKSLKWVNHIIYIPDIDR